MCVKLLFENLNLGLWPLYFSSTYTCRVTIALKVHGSKKIILIEAVENDMLCNEAKKV